MDWARSSVGSFLSAWSRLPVSTRVVTGFLLILLTLVAVWGATSGGREGWVKIVGADQTFERRAEIVTKLRELGIETRVGGDSISVPVANADEAMLQLHSSGTLGDEAFFNFLKETDLFGTRDKRDRQWLVAVQGRLAAMIQSLDYVRRAWVQIAEPADSKRPWWADARESTAAVILEPEPNQSVTTARARGIASLVAGAIPGLKPSGVKILDRSGRLFRFSESELGCDMDMIERQLSLASMIEEKVRRMLPDESRVSAQVRLVSEKRQGEKIAAIDGGDERTRWESGPGGIECISVAVLIPENSPGVPTGTAARGEYARQLKGVVRDAAGAKEGDPVSILIAPLSAAPVTEAQPAAVPPPPAPTPWFRAQAPMLGLCLLGSIALVVASRLARGVATAPEGVVESEESLRSPGESILSAQDEVLDRIRDGVKRSVARNPREAAAAARRWMAP